MVDFASINHRRSVRLREYDYSSPGAYFVTIVTHGYKCLFGKVIDNKMHLNDIGTIVQKCWIEIPNHYHRSEVEPFVIMPNHLHGVITINESRGTIYRAPYSRAIRNAGCWIDTDNHTII